MAAGLLPFPVHRRPHHLPPMLPGPVGAPVRTYAVNDAQLILNGVETNLKMLSSTSSDLHRKVLTRKEDLTLNQVLSTAKRSGPLNPILDVAGKVARGQFGDRSVQTNLLGILENFNRDCFAIGALSAQEQTDVLRLIAALFNYVSRCNAEIKNATIERRVVPLPGPVDCDTQSAHILRQWSDSADQSRFAPVFAPAFDPGNSTMVSQVVTKLQQEQMALPASVPLTPPAVMSTSSSSLMPPRSVPLSSPSSVVPSGLGSSGPVMRPAPVLPPYPLMPMMAPPPPPPGGGYVPVLPPSPFMPAPPPPPGGWRPGLMPLPGAGYFPATAAAAPPPPPTAAAPRPLGAPPPAFLSVGPAPPPPLVPFVHAPYSPPLLPPAFPKDDGAGVMSLFRPGFVDDDRI